MLQNESAVFVTLVVLLSPFAKRQKATNNTCGNNNNLRFYNKKRVRDGMRSIQSNIPPRPLREGTVLKITNFSEDS